LQRSFSSYKVFQLKEQELGRKEVARIDEILNKTNVQKMSAALEELEAEEALIRCGTTKGDIVMHLYRKWSPHGYDRAVALYEHGFYDHSHFFRTVPNFLVQFGISYTDDVELQKKARSTIPDDPQLDPPIPFDVGTISYAGTSL
jgi:hypothetical protein